MRRNMKLATYRCLQVMAATLCCSSMAVFGQAVKPTTLSGALLAVGWGDWAAVALVSLSFGLVALLQRFKRAEAGDNYSIFIAAHMGGSLLAGIIVYLVSQGAMDSPNRFMQALAIGCAGWTGAAIIDKVAAKFNGTLLGSLR